jgi:tetratricopeptide (TPR) repeat protein
MQAAFDRLQSYDVSDLNLKILEHLAYAHYEQGNLDKALRAAEKLTELAPSNHSSADEWRQNLKLYRKKLSESKDANSKDSADEAKNSIKTENKAKSTEEKEKIESWERYKQLCRGQMPTNKTAGNASKLMCYLKRDKVRRS